MEHAGVAITITTFTDLVAFAIASFSSKIFFIRLAQRFTLYFCKRRERSKIVLKTSLSWILSTGIFATLPS